MSLHLITLLAMTPIQPGNIPQAAASTQTLKTLLNVFFDILGALAVLMIAISGFRYVISDGDPQKAGRAKEGIIYALVGLILAITAEAIVAFVVNRV